jgi:hypothetical protein
MFVWLRRAKDLGWMDCPGTLWSIGYIRGGGYGERCPAAEKVLLKAKPRGTVLSS